MGDEGFEKEVLFDQSPCEYEQIYYIQMIDKSTNYRIDVPAFITHDGELLLFDSPVATDSGRYDIKVCSKIFNSVNTTSCVNFNLIVDPLPANNTYTTMPDFLLNLEDQRVKVGDALKYSLGLPENTAGYIMNVEVFLGDAFRFSIYDETLNLFKVHATKLKKEDVGEYRIKVTARLKNEKFDDFFRKTFILTVYDDPPKVEAPWFPPNPIWYDEWGKTYARVNKT